MNKSSPDVQISSRLRVGKISYANTIPFYHKLSAGGGEWVVVEGHPTEINRLMQDECVDIAPISSLEYAMHPERYWLLPGVCIGCRGFSGSVLLISKEKMERLNGKTVALTDASLSSQALLRILLKQHYGFENNFVEGSGDPARMLASADACLAIGDRALFFRPDQFVYKYDLGELWHLWTGKPFCFSVWAVRRSFYERQPESVLSFHTQIIGNTKRNLEDLKLLIEENLSLSQEDERFASVYGYFSNLRFHLDDEMKAGLLHYFQLACELQLIPAVPRLEFLPLSPE